jgi:hypothetical protein
MQEGVRNAKRSRATDKLCRYCHTQTDTYNALYARNGLCLTCAGNFPAEARRAAGAAPTGAAPSGAALQLLAGDATHSPGGAVGGGWDSEEMEDGTQQVTAEVGALRAEIDELRKRIEQMQMVAAAAQVGGAADAAAQAAHDAALEEELASADQPRALSEAEDGDGEVPEDELSGSEAEEAAEPPAESQSAEGAQEENEDGAEGAALAAAALPPPVDDDPTPQRPEPLRPSAGQKLPRAWRDRGGYGLHGDTRVTVLEHAARLVLRQVDGGVPNSSLAGIMEDYAMSAPPDHSYPTTIAQLDAVLGVSSTAHRELERDACCGWVTPDGSRLLTPGCHVFPKEEAAGDCCSGCGMSRWLFWHADPSKRVRHNPQMYLFPCGDTLQSIYDDPVWRRAQALATRDSDIFAGEYYKNANARSGGLLTSKTNGLFDCTIFEVGWDEVTLKDNSRANTAVGLVRTHDISIASLAGPGTGRGSPFNVRPLFLRPQSARMADGSWPPLAPYLSEFRQFVKKHSATPYVLRDGRAVKVLWLTANADGPAAEDVMNGGGSVAYFNNPGHFFTGQHLGRDGGCMRYFGYFKPQTQHGCVRWMVDRRDGSSTKGMIVPYEAE